MQPQLGQPHHLKYQAYDYVALAAFESSDVWWRDARCVVPMTCQKCVADVDEELALVLDPSVVLVPPRQQAAAATVESESRRGRPRHLQLGCPKHPG